MKDIHIGQIVKQKQEESGMKITDFAQAIGCNRNNIYDLFRRKEIDFQRLKIISKVLNYDFLLEYIDSSDYLIIAETNENKLLEMQQDKTIKIWFYRYLCGSISR
ncbi:hypothetical protein FACS189429_7000 [Bacteroidia bacterium]|nr:hypothetical protein FACS189429_7000 [Bacteroidia bacterium]GHV43055.1 hypothetical protein FACS1894180_1030 [Bacteroidia bacterium]